jgi:hypothetical protein
MDILNSAKFVSKKQAIIYDNAKWIWGWCLKDIAFLPSPIGQWFTTNLPIINPQISKKNSNFYSFWCLTFLYVEEAKKPWDTNKYLSFVQLWHKELVCKVFDWNFQLLIEKQNKSKIKQKDSFYISLCWLF